jgi:hypothetical protein
MTLLRNPLIDRCSRDYCSHTLRSLLLVTFVLIAVASTPEWRAAANAQERPADADLASIIEQLTSHHREGSTVEFVNTETVTSRACRMKPASMKISRGSDSKLFPVLIESQDGRSKGARLFAKLNRLSVDADGAGRAYHADDPFGDQTCIPETQQFCALDNFSDAGMRLFLGATRLRRADPKAPATDEPEFLQNWHDLWPLIRDETLTPLSLRQIARPGGPREYNLIYWKERNLTFAFNTKIIPATTKGFPCRFGRDSEYAGYFISATTFKKHSITRSDGCKPQQYLDAAKVPFFVVPTEKFGGIELGDIAIGILRTQSGSRLVYGIAGDTGPYDHFGEGSIAFNKALLDVSRPIEKERDVDPLDINLAEDRHRLGADASLGVLLLGGTKRLLRNNYSAANIMKIGEAQFRRWQAETSGSDARLDACFNAAQ